MAVTQIATAMAALTWMTVSWAVHRRPSVLGAAAGAVAGLVAITPAAGFVTANGAILIGVLAGVVPFYACSTLKNALGYDDALDTFGVHAVGGTMGAFLTGMLARNSANGNLATNLKEYVTDSPGQKLLFEQVKAIGVTLILAVVGTIVIAFIVKAVLGLRPTAEAEQEGLDLSDHGEEGYILEAKG